MKPLLITTAVLFFSTLLLSAEVKKTKNNKMNLGNVKINAPTEISTLEVKGELRLASDSGYVGFTPAAETGSTTYTLPTADGTNGEFLTTNGSGTLSWTKMHLYRTDCPQGFTLIGTPDSAEAFCISSTQETASTWLKAITNCYNKPTKARLCSASEWAMSCAAEKIQNMTGHWEWVSDSGNNYGRIIGLAGCDSFNGATVDAHYPSRCCFR